MLFPSQIRENLDSKILYKYITNINIFFKKINSSKAFYFHRLIRKSIFNIYKNLYYQIGYIRHIVVNSTFSSLLIRNKIHLFQFYYNFIFFKLEQQNRSYIFSSANILNSKNFNFFIVYVFIMIPVFFIEYII